MVTKIEPPKYLDKVGKEHWKSVEAILISEGHFGKADQDWLALYCSLYSRWREAEAMVKAEGAVIIARNGYAQKNPWYDISVQCLKDMKPFLDRFGFSPVARTKLKPVETEDDPLQIFLKKGTAANE